MHGCPAAGMQVELHRVGADGAASSLARLVLNADGRSDGGPLLEGTDLLSGRYRLVFSVGDYFRGRGVVVPEPSFVDVVTLDFGIADATTKWHVPLLVSPWAWSTYRGS
jgi:5-hydroxyisourate hydrolase